MKWHKYPDKKPPKCPHDDMYSIHVMISDGSNIGIGYYEYEYDPEDPDDDLLYSSPRWHDQSNMLKTCYSGFAEVTHWALMPSPPKKDG